ncbi:hypothetical protein Hanom_Chr16g01499201 [Helianthus anomalus]
MAVAVSEMVGVSILVRLGFRPVLSESSLGSVTVRRRLTRLDKPYVRSLGILHLYSCVISRVSYTQPMSLGTHGACTGRRGRCGQGS